MTIPQVLGLFLWSVWLNSLIKRISIEEHRYSTYFTFSMTPTGTPMHTVAANRLCSEICLSQPYSITEPKVPVLKQR